MESPFKISLNNDGAMPSPAETSQPSSGSAASHLRDAAIKDARDELGRRPRRARSDRVSADDQRALQDKVNAAIAAQLETLYDPKNFAALLGLPADAALALSGKDRWKLSDEERATLGSTGAAAARTLMITNPRGLAFAMCGAAMFGVYMPRLIAQLKEMRDAESKKGKSDAAT